MIIGEYSLVDHVPELQCSETDRVKLILTGNNLSVSFEFWSSVDQLCDMTSNCPDRLNPLQTFMASRIVAPQLTEFAKRTEADSVLSVRSRLELCLAKTNTIHTTSDWFQIVIPQYCTRLLLRLDRLRCKEAAWQSKSSANTWGN